MKLLFVPIAIATVLGVLCISAIPAVAGESTYQPDPSELAPETPVECPWSKLQSVEYKTCLERKRFFDRMSADEKKRFNAEVEKRRQITVRIDRGGGTIGTSSK